MLVVATVIVVFTGRLARDVGKALGMTTAAVDIWSIAKWPLLVILVAILFAVLYWASPNASFGRFRWISRGGLLAVVIWLIASAAFAFYLTNFNSYNKVYGSLATVIAFLVWLWISNIAFLLGAEFDAELQRGRAIEAGMPADHEPYMPLRDTRKLSPGPIPVSPDEDPADEPVAEGRGA
jgi:membrane protein